MRVLITGGAGFIGAHVVRAYLEAGHQVAAVDDLSAGERQNIPKEVPFYRVSVCDQEALEEILDRERPDVVNHHAALVSVRESHRQPARYQRVNVQGTRNLLQAGHKVGVRKFILASSGGAIYGQPDRMPIAEGCPRSPLSPYGKTKVEAEDLLQSQDGRPKIVILRYGNVYGPGQNPLRDNGVIGIFSRALLCGESPLVFGDGSQRRDYVYVEDVARANVLALGPSLHGVFNVATGEGRSLVEVYRAIATLLGKDPPLRFGPANPFEVSDNVLDVSRAWEALGWRASMPFDLGLARTVEWITAEFGENKGLSPDEAEIAAPDTLA